MTRKLLYLVFICCLGAASAQRNIQAPEEVPDATTPTYVHDAVTQVSIASGDLLQLIYDCNEAGSAIIDVDGAQHYRVYGFDFVSDLEYSASGPRAFSPATQRAQTRAMGSAAEFLLGFSAFVSRELEESTERANAASSAQTNGERTVSESVSTASGEILRRVYRTQSFGFLRGGRPSGISFTSLGDGFGYCVVARYDIPLVQEGQENDDSGRDGSNAQPTTANGDSGDGSTADSNYKPLPPGRVGF